jgi:hypothetical protein
MPYQINNAADWQELMTTPENWGDYFILTQDIDLAGIEVMPVGTAEHGFYGIFDGNGHTISNAVINQPDDDYAGLFGRLSSYGTITRLGVKDIAVTGYYYVGGLAGYTYDGIISGCYATGTVNGYCLVGGLVGYSNFGSLSACYARADVSGDSTIGGLVGSDYDSSIADCFAVGLVSGNSEGGGLMGWSWKGSHATTACFWDIETSGTTDGVGGMDPDPAGVMGRTTAEMMAEAMFTDAGWDFADTWRTWYPPEEHYPELFLPMGPFTLTMQTNPSQAVSSITPSTGEHALYGPVEIHADDFAACPNRYEFDHWEGNVADPLSRSTSLFVDADTTVTAVFTVIPPVCGDECHPYPKMDFSKNCRVDLADFIMFAAEWMDCTAPECD